LEEAEASDARGQTEHTETDQASAEEAEAMTNPQVYAQTAAKRCFSHN
jgi:hypothetical protein